MCHLVYPIISPKIPMTPYISRWREYNIKGSLNAPSTIVLVALNRRTHRQFDDMVGEFQTNMVGELREEEYHTLKFLNFRM